MLSLRPPVGNLYGVALGLVPGYRLGVTSEIERWPTGSPEDKEDGNVAATVSQSDVVGAPGGARLVVSNTETAGAVGPDEPDQVECPNCRATFPFQPELAGKRFSCPYCKTVIRIPKSESPEHRREVAEEVTQPEIKLAATDGLCEEGCRLAKEQAKQALKHSLGTFFSMVIYPWPLWLILWLVFKDYHLSGWLVVPIACAFGFCSGVFVYARKYPWYKWSEDGLLKAAAAHREEAKEKERVRLEADGRKLEAAEESERLRREENEERQRTHTDAGRSECWRSLGWWDFEIAVLLVFESLGGEARATEPSRDAGLDGIVDFEGETYGIQCKHFGAKEYVGVGEIRDFIGALHMKGLEKGQFVTTGQYSASAVQLARDSLETSVKVRLLSINDLVEMGTGLRLTKELLAEAKERWHVPQEPPPDMPQGPRRKRRYRRFRHRW